ncbi:hypothetical protein MKW94_014502 [Papaver nudicaule]|uniref:UBC core domain-containing protein n=1 Tax=Papaver nudicaule TaxID=74823 RepID=A0AA41S3W3_PAPNU|nr:hypothetical protein [Papaver nudicaule]MCL7030019.1 hypothetical protein [Papaver nudicaule]
MAGNSRARIIIQKELTDLMRNPVDWFSAGLVWEDNIFEWILLILGPPDTPYFSFLLITPPVLCPPTVKFVSDMWHPNIYPDGEVCISILHAGEDPYGYELFSERWSPVHTVESIVLSIISLLSSPNDEASANVEAAIEWRDKREDFIKSVKRTVRRSQEG